MKTLEQIIQSQYVSQADITRLTGINKNKAKIVFDRCYLVDKEELGDRMIYQRKVRIGTLLKDQKINLNTLLKQIKSA